MRTFVYGDTIDKTSWGFEEMLRRKILYLNGKSFVGLALWATMDKKIRSVHKRMTKFSFKVFRVIFFQWWDTVFVMRRTDTLGWYDWNGWQIGFCRKANQILVSFRRNRGVVNQCKHFGFDMHEKVNEAFVMLRYEWSNRNKQKLCH